MIAGTVNDEQEAIVQLRVQDANGKETRLNALVDTGFTGALAMSVDTLARLGLHSVFEGWATLADGSVRQLELYPVEVDRAGKWETLMAYGIGDDEALLGMQFLAGHVLRVVVASGGDVSITPLP